MAYPKFRRLQLERLETRETPSSMTYSAPSSEPSPSSSGTYYSDPTFAPSTPTSTAVAVQITSVGGASGSYFSLTVTGLNDSNLQPGTPMAINFGTSTTYQVLNYTVNQDGSVRLTLSNSPGLAEAVSNTTTATVYFGNGGSTTSPPPSSSPSSSPMDPTMNPQG